MSCDDKVSVIMPVYNGADYLAEAIESILNQTFRNLELIIVDDGSSDRSFAIAELYKSKDERVVLIKNSENMGVSISRNSALQVANGNYIALMDADDISLPNRLRRQIEEMKRLRLDVCGSAIQYFGARSGVKYFPERDSEIRINLICNSRTLANPTVMMKAEIAKRFTYEANLGYGEDLIYFLDIMLNAKARFGNLREPLVKYRSHSGQASRKLANERKYLMTEVVANRFVINRSSNIFSQAQFEEHYCLVSGAKAISDINLEQYVHFIIHAFSESGIDLDSSATSYFCRKALNGFVPRLKMRLILNPNVPLVLKRALGFLRANI